MSEQLTEVTATIVRRGLESLEAGLPAACSSQSDLDAIGETIKKAKAVEKFANETFKQLAAPFNRKVDALRAQWKPLAERAAALVTKATALVEALLAEQVAKRKAEEEAARQVVAEKQRLQAEAEAKALASSSPEQQKQLTQEADEAWKATKAAVEALDKGPVQTAVKVGSATVYEASRLDYEITDMGAFATAHPELVEIRRGDTLKALRAATAGMVNLPETITGWPGVRLRMTKKAAAR